MKLQLIQLDISEKECRDVALLRLYKHCYVSTRVVDNAYLISGDVYYLCSEPNSLERRLMRRTDATCIAQNHVSTPTA